MSPDPAPFDPFAPADPLGEALHLLRMNGGFYARSELTAPWGTSMPAMPGYLWFHVVIAGSFRLETPGAEPAIVERGDLVLIPKGEGHALLSDAGVPAPSILEIDREAISERYEVIRMGGDGPPTTLICGAVRFDHPAARSLIDVLPPVIHMEAAGTPQMDRIQATLSLMAAEARELRPGGEAVITRLGDIVVIQAIRAWIESDPAARTGWLGALQDPQIGPAITAIHRDPSREWTVAELAKEPAMSRSAFSARFTEVVGEPVMAYVTRWRMQVAYEALSTEGATVAELTERLGYRSEAALARAFKRVIGKPPGAVKREGAAVDPALAQFVPGQPAGSAL
jgi:AraC-like DNA-binding protein